MPNPLSGLKPALEVLAQNVDILPATGQAVEDLLRPDQEEVEDRHGCRERAYHACAHCADRCCHR